MPTFFFFYCYLRTTLFDFDLFVCLSFSSFLTVWFTANALRITNYNYRMKLNYSICRAARAAATVTIAADLWDAKSAINGRKRLTTTD